MKRIDVSTPKHPNTFALVDDEDYERVIAGPKWCAYKHYPKKSPYAARSVRINGARTTQLMHRFILSASPGLDIDHANLNGLDNQKSNLRLATREQNAWNVGLRKTNSSGYKGVCWHKRDRVWMARIRHNGRRVHLGLFKSAEEAYEAYKTAAHQLHGKFARAA